MNIFDYIFPADKEIIIYGAGKRGVCWAELLRQHGKCIKCFLDKCSLGGDVGGVPIMLPKTMPEFNGIVLISPLRGVDEIYDSCRSLGFENIIIGNLLKFLPMNCVLQWEDIASFPAFGEYYSLYPNLDDVEMYYDKVLDGSESGSDLDGIEFNEAYQIKILERMNELYLTRPIWSSSVPKEGDKYRYWISNSTFGLNDAYVLHFMIRIFSPKQFIEVGCGLSSAVTMDTCEYYLDNECSLGFIEPYPERFYSILKETDKHRFDLKEKCLQDIPLEYFAKLEQNDILFIDSTHVSKFGSDVNYLFFHILPRMRHGVIVHLHDIFYPWQYPLSWQKKGMGWNEMFLLRAFLMCNQEWEILYYSSYMEKRHYEKYCVAWREDGVHSGGSFWMRKK